MLQYFDYGTLTFKVNAILNRSIHFVGMQMLNSVDKATFTSLICILYHAGGLIC